MDSGFHVEVLRTMPAVEALAPVWTAWPAHRDSDFKVCTQFVWTRPEVMRPHVIVLYREGQPEAMLVGRLERTRVRSKVGYLPLPGISARVMMFSYGGLLGNGSEENSRRIMASALSALSSGEADMIALDHLRVGAPIYQQATLDLGFARADHCVKPEPHCFMSLGEDEEAVYRSMSQGLRAEIRRKKKKLREDFGDDVRIECFRDVAKLDGLIPQLEGIARKTYQRGLGVGFEDSEQMRQCLRVYAENRMLRIYLLTLRNEPCAFWVGTMHDGIFCSDHNGYDPSFRKYSLGTVLLASMIEDFCKDGVKGIDFGFGEAEYKERFGNQVLQEASVRIFAPSVRGLTLNVLRTFAGLVDDNARKLLARTNLLPRIKRAWRARAETPAPSGTGQEHV